MRISFTMLDQMLLKRVLSCCTLLALTSLLAACGEDDRSGSPGSRPLKIVATTTQAADLAANVGGDHVDVVGLLGANTDPHAYELRPRDVQALADAALIVRSGGEIDAWLSEAIKSSGTKAPVVTLIDSVKTLDGRADAHEAEHAGEAEHADEDEHAEEQTDPHWWHDPGNGALATTTLGEALAKADRSRAVDYGSAAAHYAQRLRELDTALAACWSRVPRGQRKLVTTHDALGYYARRYGLEVIGAVIPSLSTKGQPSAGETADLVKAIKHANVRAIFAETRSTPRSSRRSPARPAPRSAGRSGPTRSGPQAPTAPLT